MRGRGAVLSAIHAGLRAGLAPPIVRDVPSGARYELGTDWVTRTIAIAGSWEPEECALLRARTPAGGVFVDVGANVGYYAVQAAGWVGPTGRVLAFEPAARTRARLMRNLALNADVADRVTVLPVGCGAHAAVIHLAAVGDPGLAFVTADASEGAESIETVTIDEAVRAAGVTRVDVMKIDIEGYELEALRGATETLRRCRPVVLFEVELLSRFGASDADARVLMESSGYDCTIIQNANSRDMLCMPRN